MDHLQEPFSDCVLPSSEKGGDKPRETMLEVPLHLEFIDGVLSFSEKTA